MIPRPASVAKAVHKEHQDEDQTHEIDTQPAHTVVARVTLKNAFEAEGHESVLRVIRDCTGIRRLENG
jgi:hypothetical protein